MDGAGHDVPVNRAANGKARRPNTGMRAWTADPTR